VNLSSALQNNLSELGYAKFIDLKQSPHDPMTIFFIGKDGRSAYTKNCGF